LGLGLGLVIGAFGYNDPWLQQTGTASIRVCFVKFASSSSSSSSSSRLFIKSLSKHNKTHINDGVRIKIRHYVERVSDIVINVSK